MKAKHCDVEMHLTNCYGGRPPLVIELHEGEEADKLKALVMGSMKNYVNHGTSKESTCLLNRRRRSIVRKCWRCATEKGSLALQRCIVRAVFEGGYSDRALTEIRDRYMHVLGFDPVWRYPFCHDAGLGAVQIPVKEGYLWLPYSVIDIADNELYETESATLLEVESCELLIEEMKRYVEPLISVMKYVADEL